MRKRLILIISLGSILVLLGGLAVKKKMDADSLTHYSKKFQLLTSLRKKALKSHFETIDGELLFWSDSKRIKAATARLVDGWLALGDKSKDHLQHWYIDQNPHALGERELLSIAEDGSAYSIAHKDFHDLGVNLLNERGYYDFFLVDAAGNIIYTVEKEADFATNLVDGEYADSGLGKLFKNIVADETIKTHIVDFQSYQPSNGDAAIFTGRKLIDDNGEFIGVIAFQLATRSIMQIMGFEGGMGQFGETYIVGEDRYLRSNSRFSEEPLILQVKNETAAVDKAFAGETGYEFSINHNNREVLSAYDSIQIGDFRWAILAEIEKSMIENANPISNLTLLLSSFLTLVLGMIGTFLSLLIRGSGGLEIVADIFDETSADSM